MDKRWIKLHSKLLGWQWISDPNMVAVWVHLLLMANWKDHEWQGIKIKKGQLVTGRKSLSKSTGISEQTLRTCIERLKSTNEITLKSTSQFSIITIVKWRDYQGISKNQPTNQPTNQPATNQRPTTLVEGIEDKDKDIATKVASWVLEEKLQEMEKTPNSYLDIIATFIREKPVEVENAKQLSNIIGRYCRIAQKLSGAYTNKQIFAMAERIRKDNEKRQRQGDEIDWTLETIYKYLTK